MKIDEIYAAVEGNIGKSCEVTLKDGSRMRNVIYHGTMGDTSFSPPQFYLIVSEGKGENKISFYDIESINF